MYAVLPFFQMDSLAPLVGRPDRVTREAGRAGLMRGEQGRREY